MNMIKVFGVPYSESDKSVQGTAVNKIKCSGYRSVYDKSVQVTVVNMIKVFRVL